MLEKTSCTALPTSVSTAITATAATQAKMSKPRLEAIALPHVKRWVALTAVTLSANPYNPRGSTRYTRTGREPRTLVMSVRGAI
jgi:hypothetical protein